MAGDFVMVEHATPRKPEVLRIAGALGVHPIHAFGLCVMAWMWFDEQTEDGHAKNVTPEMLDAVVGHVGFAKALAAASWLEIYTEELVVPRFDRLMGESAKKRANDNKRQRKHRSKSATSVTDESQNARDQNVTKEEKRREKKRRDTIPEAPAGSEAENPLPEVPESVRTVWQQWLQYKREKRQVYQPTGLHQAIVHLQNRIAEIGPNAVKSMMVKAMASGWNGWDHPERDRPASNGATTTQRKPVSGIPT